MATEIKVREMPKNRQNTKKGSNPPWRHTKDTQTYIEFCDTPQHCTDFYCGMSCRPFTPPLSTPMNWTCVGCKQEAAAAEAEAAGASKILVYEECFATQPGRIYPIYSISPERSPFADPPNGRPFLSPLTIFPDWFGFLLLARRSMLQMSK